MVLPGTKEHTILEIYRLLELKKGDPIITRRDLRNLTSDIEPSKCYKIDEVIFQVSGKLSTQNLSRDGFYKGEKTKYHGQAEFNLPDVKNGLIKIDGKDNYFPSFYFNL